MPSSPPPNAIFAGRSIVFEMTAFSMSFLSGSFQIVQVKNHPHWFEPTHLLVLAQRRKQGDKARVHASSSSGGGLVGAEQPGGCERRRAAAGELEWAATELNELLSQLNELLLLLSS